MNSINAVITGSGIYHPKESISNDELVHAFNQFVKIYNFENKKDIEAGAKEPLYFSSAEYIEKVSGICSRYVVDKAGILNPTIMHPIIEERLDSELSLQAEMGVKAAEKAISSSNIKASDIDAVIMASSNIQRPFPSIAIEIQHSLGIEGFAYDLNAACASASFALDNAVNLITAGKANCVLVVNPEICTAYLNFRARDSHFILGDAASAIIIENKNTTRNLNSKFEIISTSLKTKFSNNVRNNFGFLAPLNAPTLFADDKLFYQNGKKVFKEVSMSVYHHILAHLEQAKLDAQDIKRYWLHQANINMNQLITKKLCNQDIDNDRFPVVLDEYANTASCGAIIAFNKSCHELNIGEYGIISSFGAGYTIGSILIKRIR